eukprot:TRINITY_DN88880_c0_g1_i1.p1 TRINITY_DN88880_c0_g1~~TRINITY_DN88880_c0_g1_i1.p1  ORF type:complete len:1040 (-),score=116.42 TRINITY_DN88880_c0_g1_i1:112-3231(-)
MVHQRPRANPSQLLVAGFFRLVLGRPVCPPPSIHAGRCSLDVPFVEHYTWDIFKQLDVARSITHRFGKSCAFSQGALDACAVSLFKAVAISELLCGLFYYACFSADDWQMFVRDLCTTGEACAPQIYKLLANLQNATADDRSRSMVMVLGYIFVVTRELAGQSAEFDRGAQDQGLRGTILQDPLVSEECPYPGHLVSGHVQRLDSQSMPTSNPSVARIIEELRTEQIRPTTVEILNLGAGDGTCDEEGWQYDPANCLVRNFTVRGAWVEADPSLTPQLVAKVGRSSVFAEHADPETIVDLLDRADITPTPDLLKLDVDNCDCRIAERILNVGKVMPLIVFVEINPYWPPPIQLNCTWQSDGGFFSGSGLPEPDTLLGCTLQDYMSSLESHYKLLYVEFNNALFIRRDLPTLPSLYWHLASTHTWSAKDHWRHGFWCHPVSRFFGIPIDLDAPPLLPNRDNYFLSRWPGVALTEDADRMAASMLLKIRAAALITAPVSLNIPAIIDCRGDESWAVFADGHGKNATVLFQDFSNRHLLDARELRLAHEVFLAVLQGSKEYSPKSMPCLNGYMVVFQWCIRSGTTPCCGLDKTALSHASGLLAPLMWLDDISWNPWGSLDSTYTYQAVSTSKLPTVPPQLRRFTSQGLVGDTLHGKDISLPILVFGTHLERTEEIASAVLAVKLQGVSLTVSFLGEFYPHLREGPNALKCGGIVETLQFAGRSLEAQFLQQNWEEYLEQMLMGALTTCNKLLATHRLIVNTDPLYASYALRTAFDSIPILHSWDSHCLLGALRRHVQWLQNSRSALLDHFVTNSPLVSSLVHHVTGKSVPSLSPVAHYMPMRDGAARDTDKNTLRVLFWRSDEFWHTDKGGTFWRLVNLWTAANKPNWKLDNPSYNPGEYLLDGANDFDAIIFVPTDVVQTGFWEAYSRIRPLFMPSMPCQIKLFDQTQIFPEPQRLVEEMGLRDTLGSSLSYQQKMLAWGPMSDHYNFPHIQYFSSPKGLVWQLISLDLPAISNAMRKELQLEKQLSIEFYATVLTRALDY